MKGSTLRVFIDVLEKTLTHSEIDTLYLVMDQTAANPGGNKRARLVALLRQLPGTKEQQTLVNEYAGLVGARPSVLFKELVKENQELVRLLESDGFTLSEDWHVDDSETPVVTDELDFLDFDAQPTNQEPSYTSIVDRFEQSKDRDELSSLAYSAAAHLQSELGKDHAIVQDVLARARRLGLFDRAAALDQFSNEAAGLLGILRAGELLLAPKRAPLKSMTTMSKNSRIFISHAATDKPLVKSVVDLIEKSFVMPHPNPIRCTSLPGYSLPSGVLTSEALRSDLAEAAVVIGILTEKSLQSSWVQFELGAAWGSGTWTVPLIAPPLQFADLPGPLRERNAMMMSSRENIAQLIGELESKTVHQVRDFGKRNQAIEDYLEVVKGLVGNGQRTPIPSQAQEAAEEMKYSLECSGENPAHTIDVEIPIKVSSRLRYSMTQLELGQAYTFYFRYYADGNTPRWIGTTNKPNTDYITASERSTTEWGGSSPNHDVNILTLITDRFPNASTQGVVIDRFRLRGDADNPAPVRAHVRIW